MRTPKYPGIRATVDGSEAVAWVEGHLCQAAFAHATVPADRMLERFERMAAAGARNVWGESLQFTHHECGHSACAACEGFALAGGRVTSFTSGQELINMQEVLHACAGKRLPMVFHVAARSLMSHAVTVHAGHDDILAVRDSGWAILFARNAQEAADFTVIARRAAELSETPFLVVQDGFLTTHTIETIRLPEPELLKVFVGAPSRRLRNLFNPLQPLISGPLENQDSYMKGRIAQRFFCERVRPAIENVIADYQELTGRRLGFVRGYRMEDAEFAVTGLGSMMDAAEVAVDAMRARGVRAGALTITTLRPFPRQEILKALARCRVVSVIERADMPLAESNPLSLEIKSMLAGAQMGDEARLLHVPEVYSGAAGLGGRAVTPADFVAAFDNMASFGRPRFVLGIKHPDALTTPPALEMRPPGVFSLRVHSLAGYGSAAAARLVVSVASDVFHLEAVAAEQHGAEERGLPTTTVVALAPKRVEIHSATAIIDLAVVQSAHSFLSGDPLAGVRVGGMLLLQTEQPAATAWESLPIVLRRVLRERQITLFVYDAQRNVSSISRRSDLMQRMQGAALLGAVLRVAAVRGAAPRASAPEAGELFESVQRSLQSRFATAGAEVIAEDLRIARRAFDEVTQVTPPEQIVDYEKPASLKRASAAGEPLYDPELVPPGFCEHVVRNYVNGRDAIVEADLYAARGLMPAGTSAQRSFRHLSAEIPRFTASHCTGCMECVNLCPDSAIGACVVDAETAEHAPSEIHEHFGFTQKYYESFLKRGESGGLFGLYIDADRCKGCGECVSVCGARDALAMTPKSSVDLHEYDRARDFFALLPDTHERFLAGKSLGDMMLSARARLYGGGSGSCSGCGEATAIRMMLAATGFVYGAGHIGVVSPAGCHTAAGSTFPFNPYQVSWTNVAQVSGPAEAMGVRAKWDREGHANRRLWVVGADDALFGAGFQSLIRLIESGLDIKVLVLDKSAQSAVGDLGVRLLSYPGTFVAQTTAAHVNHFYKAVLAANAFPGPAVVICYSACVTDHGIPGDAASHEARLAVDCRAFPLFAFDPGAGDQLRQRLDLRGNPAIRDDWYHDPKTVEAVDFLVYARSQQRFAGYGDDHMQALKRRCLGQWRTLREMAGLL